MLNTHRQLQPMTDDMLRATAPSIFAMDKHESRSDRYTYIPTFDVVQAMRREGFVPVLAKQSRTRIPGKAPFTKHMIRFQRLDAPAVSNLGDVVASLCLVNAHDGTAAYHLISALDRLICLNGLTAKLADMGEIRVQHSGNIIERVVDGSFKVIEASAVAMEQAYRWNAITLDSQETLAFGAAAARLRFSSDQNVSVPALVAPRREADRDPTLWNVFNRAQESLLRGGQRYVTQGSETTRARRLRVRPVNSIDKDVGLNQALWTLAAEMAKLKA